RPVRLLRLRPYPPLFPYPTLSRSPPYHDPLRPPLDSPPLPGSTGHGQATLPGRVPGAEEALSSSQDNPPTVPRPLRREVLKRPLDRKSTRLNSSHVKISYAVFCLK